MARLRVSTCLREAEAASLRRRQEDGNGRRDSGNLPPDSRPRGLDRAAPRAYKPPSLPRQRQDGLRGHQAAHTNTSPRPQGRNVCPGSSVGRAHD